MVTWDFKRLNERRDMYAEFGPTRGLKQNPRSIDPPGASNDTCLATSNTGSSDAQLSLCNFARTLPAFEHHSMRT